MTAVDDCWPLLTGPDGRFGRPVQAGAFTMEIDAPGYVSEIVSFDTTLDGPREIVLEPEALIEVEPTPSLLSQGGSGWFELGAESSSVVFFRPGEETVAAR